MQKDNLSVGVFIDGGYYAKINEALNRQGHKDVNIKSLFKFITEQVAKIEGVSPSKCFITEAHFYRGRYRVDDAYDKNLLYSERKFEDTLIENDVIFHYKHLREVRNNKGNVTVIEKGVDVWFALEAYEMALYRDFDFTVLISGDADHEMLARKLKALKTHVILLTWDPTHTGSTSKFLSEEVCTHIEISKLVQQDQKLLNTLVD